MATIPTGPAKIGRYQILGELGRGAMGRVYRAFDPNIGRNIALKVIPLDTADPEQAQRFRREAQAAGILSHPNIVTIYDAGEDGGFLYIAMELVDGPTLQHLLAQGPLPLEQALSLAEQASAALDHAHARAIVHRDIKPANLMVQAGILKVTDFGVAKSGMTGLTSTGQVLGTPSYLAPEVVKGGAADARSDIFSLGAVLYELFTGTRAFPGDNISTVIYRVISEQPPAPSRVLSTLPPGLNHAVLKALAKEPDERYSQCADLVADLKNYGALAAEGTVAAQPPAAAAPFPEMLDQTVKLTAVKSSSALPSPTRPSPAKAAPSIASRSKFAWITAALVVMLLAGGLFLRSRRGAAPDSLTPAAETAGGAGRSATPSPGMRATGMRATPSSAAAAVGGAGAAGSDADKPSALGAPLPPAAAPDASASGSNGAATGSPAAAPPAPVAMGRLAVHTEPPGARILLNGEETDYRAPVNFALAPGRYQITLVRAGFSDETREIVVEPNRAQELRITMKRGGVIRRLNPFRR
jgi:eukaryotic-like serine/threonine-protein kinase